MLADILKDKLLQIGPSSGLILFLLHAIVSLQFFISYFSSFVLCGRWELPCATSYVCVACKSKDNLKGPFSPSTMWALGQASGPQP